MGVRGPCNSVVVIVIQASNFDDYAREQFEKVGGNLIEYIEKISISIFNVLHY